MLARRTGSSGTSSGRRRAPGHPPGQGRRRALRLAARRHRAAARARSLPAAHADAADVPGAVRQPPPAHRVRSWHIDQASRALQFVDLEETDLVRMGTHSRADCCAERRRDQPVKVGAATAGPPSGAGSLPATLDIASGNGAGSLVELGNLARATLRAADWSSRAPARCGATGTRPWSGRDDLSRSPEPGACSTGAGTCRASATGGASTPRTRSASSGYGATSRRHGWCATRWAVA